MQTRQLARSETNRRLAGVCGGIAEYFGVDPVLIRVLFVIAGLMGWGVALYVILWIVLPKGPSSSGTVATAPSRSVPAIRIAEERYARGEISAEELHQIRGDLTRGS